MRPDKTGGDEERRPAVDQALLGGLEPLDRLGGDAAVGVVGVGANGDSYAAPRGSERIRSSAWFVNNASSRVSWPPPVLRGSRYSITLS